MIIHYWPLPSSRLLMFGDALSNYYPSGFNRFSVSWKPLVISNTSAYKNKNSCAVCFNHYCNWELRKKRGNWLFTYQEKPDRRHETVTFTKLIETKLNDWLVGFPIAYLLENILLYLYRFGCEWTFKTSSTYRMTPLIFIEFPWRFRCPVMSFKSKSPCNLEEFCYNLFHIAPTPDGVILERNSTKFYLCLRILSHNHGVDNFITYMRKPKVQHINI